MSVHYLHKPRNTDSEVCEEINSFFLVVEDSDVPTPSPVIHVIYYDIPPSRLKVRKEDFVEVKKDDCACGFNHGVDGQKTIGEGPKPVLGHGVHRYCFK
ncbi:hypothetical protein EAE99_001011 [Botrytis elliptica]|nr:hypothetical protein EAE99_001011 [Botrytis elliptica]